MSRSPLFTGVAILSLALGIGVNTAIFSLLYPVLLHALPVEHPEQLVEFLILYPGDPPLNTFERDGYEYYRDHNHVFSGITADHPARVPVQGEGAEPEKLEVHSVTGNYFTLLGLKPAIGRLIDAQDDRNSSSAIVSWPYWKTRFNLDPAILGKRIVVNDVPVKIVGVAPGDFSGLELGRQPDIWVPLSAFPGEPLRLVARMKPGVSITQARAEMAVLFRFTLEERTRRSKDAVMRQLQFAVEPAGNGLSTALREQFGKPLVALMAVVAMLLLIACTNIAGM